METNKKFELTEEKQTLPDGTVLYRIKALIDFGDIKAGFIGGWVEKETNLSQSGDAWVYGNARVSGDARVSGNAWVSGNARVYGNAWVYGNARVYGDARVSGDAWVSGNARLSGDAEVYGKKDFIVFKNWWSSGRYFTWTRSNNKWTVGCFHGTGSELIKKAYADSEESGREYERVVRYVESILTDESGNTEKKGEE